MVFLPKLRHSVLLQILTFLDVDVATRLVINLHESVFLVEGDKWGSTADDGVFVGDRVACD